MRKIQQFCETYFLCGLVTVIGIHIMLLFWLAGALEPSNTIIEIEMVPQVVTQQTMLDEQQKGFDELILTCPAEEENASIRTK